MSWVSERNLVAALSNAGAFGVIACGAMEPDRAGRGDRRHPGADRQALRREPDHHASAAGRAGGRLPRGARSGTSSSPAASRRAAPSGAPRRAGPRWSASRRRLSLAKRLVRAGADALVIEGSRGRRAYRAGEPQRAGAGDPAAHARGAGVRRRRHRPGRGDPRLPGDGRGRRAARHALRLRDREHRASALQAGLHPRRGAGRGADRADRRTLPGDPGAGAAERGHAALHGAPGGGAGAVHRRAR